MLKKLSQNSAAFLTYETIYTWAVRRRWINWLEQKFHAAEQSSEGFIKNTLKRDAKTYLSKLHRHTNGSKNFLASVWDQLFTKDLWIQIKFPQCLEIRKAQSWWHIQGPEFVFGICRHLLILRQKSSIHADQKYNHWEFGNEADFELHCKLVMPSFHHIPQELLFCCFKNRPVALSPRSLPTPLTQALTWRSATSYRRIQIFGSKT